MIFVHWDPRSYAMTADRPSWMRLDPNYWRTLVAWLGGNQLEAMSILEDPRGLHWPCTMKKRGWYNNPEVFRWHLVAFFLGGLVNTSCRHGVMFFFFFSGVTRDGTCIISGVAHVWIVWQWVRCVVITTSKPLKGKNMYAFWECYTKTVKTWCEVLNRSPAVVFVWTDVNVGSNIWNLLLLLLLFLYYYNVPQPVVVAISSPQDLLTVDHATLGTSKQRLAMAQR